MIHAADRSRQEIQEILHPSDIARVGRSGQSQHVRAVDVLNRRTGQHAAHRAYERLNAARPAEETIGIAVRSRKAKFTAALERVFSLAPADRVAVGPQRRPVDVRIWKRRAISHGKSELEVGCSRGYSSDRAVSKLRHNAKAVNHRKVTFRLFGIFGKVEGREDFSPRDAVSERSFIENSRR